MDPYFFKQLLTFRYTKLHFIPENSLEKYFHVSPELSMVTRLRECSGCMTLLSGSSELDSQEPESGFKTPLNNDSSFKILTLREFEKKCKT